MERRIPLYAVDLPLADGQRVVLAAGRHGRIKEDLTALVGDDERGRGPADRDGDVSRLVRSLVRQRGHILDVGNQQLITSNERLPWIQALQQLRAAVKALRHHFEHIAIAERRQLREVHHRGRNVCREGSRGVLIRDCVSHDRIDGFRCGSATLLERVQRLSCVETHRCVDFTRRKPCSIEHHLSGQRVLRRLRERRRGRRLLRSCGDGQAQHQRRDHRHETSTPLRSRRRRRSDPSAGAGSSSS